MSVPNCSFNLSEGFDGFGHRQNTPVQYSRLGLPALATPNHSFQGAPPAVKGGDTRPQLPFLFFKYPEVSPTLALQSARLASSDDFNPSKEGGSGRGVKLFMGGLRYELVRAGRPMVAWLVHVLSNGSIALPESFITIHRRSSGTAKGNLQTRPALALPTGCVSLFIDNRADADRLIALNHRAFCGPHGVVVTSSAEEMDLLMATGQLGGGTNIPATGANSGPTHPIVIELATGKSQSPEPVIATPRQCANPQPQQQLHPQPDMRPQRRSGQDLFYFYGIEDNTSSLASTSIGAEGFSPFLGSVSSQIVNIQTPIQTRRSSFEEGLHPSPFFTAQFMPISGTRQNPGEDHRAREMAFRTVHGQYPGGDIEFPPPPSSQQHVSSSFLPFTANSSPFPRPSPKTSSTFGEHSQPPNRK